MSIAEDIGNEDWPCDEDHPREGGLAHDVAVEVGGAERGAGWEAAAEAQGVMA